MSQSCEVCDCKLGDSFVEWMKDQYTVELKGETAVVKVNPNWKTELLEVIDDALSQHEFFGGVLKKSERVDWNK